MKYKEYTKKSTGEMRAFVVMSSIHNCVALQHRGRLTAHILLKWRESSDHVCPDMSKYAQLSNDFCKDDFILKPWAKKSKK
jgi:hypothetical protein